MKKLFNKIGQVLQLVLAAPVKLPGKVGSVLKYVALALGIVETVLDEAKPQPEVKDGKPPSEDDLNAADGNAETAAERSAGDETE